jgi:murein endopeptidase
VRGGIARETRTVLFGGARRRRRSLPRLLPLLALATAAAIGLVAVGPARARTAPPEASVLLAPPPPVDDGQGIPPTPLPIIGWRSSRAVGFPWAGHLVRGVQLPAEGPDWFTWDFVMRQSPNRGARRWGTDALVRTLLHVLREYRDAHPEAPRAGIGDLSRTHGGPFGPEFGGLGHGSHQNGLDVDVYYPRLDGKERRARLVSQVDQELAQDLVDRFVRAGAENVFVGPHLDLTGRRDVVIPLVHHDDHLHVRIPPPPR